MKLNVGKERVLVIPDLQCPFEHKQAIPFLLAIKNRFKTSRVVCIGDSMDAHAMSRWAHDPDGMSAGDEYMASLRSLRKLYKAFPNAQEVVSNHNDRIAKRVFG